MATLKELERALDEAKERAAAAESLVLGVAQAIAEMHRRGDALMACTLDRLASASEAQVETSNELLAAHEAICAALSGSVSGSPVVEREVG